MDKEKIRIVNFATSRKDRLPDFTKFQKRLSVSARHYGIKNISEWSLEDLKKYPWYENNKKLMQAKRGPGHFCWKPFIIYKELHSLPEGHFLWYLDSDMKIISAPWKLFELCDENNGFFLVEVKHKDRKLRQWTKRDAFILMDADKPKYHNAYISAAGIQLYRRCDATLAFIKEYTDWAKSPDIISDSPNKYGQNLPGFRDHRRDQSILSILMKKHNIKGFRNPVQKKDLKIYPDSDYPKILQQRNK